MRVQAVQAMARLMDPSKLEDDATKELLRILATDSNKYVPRPPQSLTACLDDCLLSYRMVFLLSVFVFLFLFFGFLFFKSCVDPVRVRSRVGTHVKRFLQIWHSAV